MNRRTILKRLGVGVATGGLAVGTGAAVDCEPPDDWEDCVLDHCNQECPEKCCGACYC